MPSLTGCIRKAGELLHPEDKAALLERAQDLRAGGMKGKEAAAQALRERADFLTDAAIAHEDAAAKKSAASGRQDQTQTPAFKAWFGDSKVVDAEGKPLVVYHGTNRDFTSFDANAPSRHIPLPGFYFSAEADRASIFAGAFGDAENNPGANVVPAFLSMRNPLDVDVAAGVNKGFVEPNVIKAVIEEAKHKGHDGVILRGWRDGSGPVQYVVFDPKQIKSAIGNRGTFDPNSPNILHDRGPQRSPSAAYQGYEPTAVPTVRAAENLTKLVEQHRDGKLTGEEFASKVASLAEKMVKVSEAKSGNRLYAERARGADVVRERLLAAKRRGDIDSDTADFALWALDQNPALAEGLGISVRAPKEGDGAGRYNPANQIMTLFKSNDNTGTAVHEILHHTERMMPPEIQAGIREEWARQYGDAVRAAVDNPKRLAALQDMAEAMSSGSREKQERLYKHFQDGTLDYDKDYHLTNPSEFWAVRATDILGKRWAADTWQAKAAQWMREMVEKVKSFFGMESDLPVLKGIDEVMASDGERLSNRQLLDGRELDDLARPGQPKPDETKLSARDIRAAVLGSFMRDEYSTFVGVESPNKPRPVSPTAPAHPIMDSIMRAVAPASRGDYAQQQANIMRANLGEMAHGQEVAVHELRKFAAERDKLPKAENLRFMDRMERGTELSNPRDAAAADALRELLDGRRDMVQELGKGQLEDFDANYFPHIWKDPEAAAALFARRPLEGSKAFLKARTIPYISDGVRWRAYDAEGDFLRSFDTEAEARAHAGGDGRVGKPLELVTDNPVELALLKVREMDRYIYGQRIFAEMKDAGLARFVRFGGEAPEGWAKINDKIARVLQPNEGEGGGFILRGDYYAPEQAATIINNHLSPGLQGNAFYDTWRGIGMAMNAAQLGLSAFHVGFTTMDAMVSKVALGVKQMSHGDVLEGAGNMVQGLNPAQPFYNLWKGDRLMRAYLGDLADPSMTPIVAALKDAGGRVKMDDFYRNATVNSFKQALRTEDYWGATKAFLPTVLDRVSAPIFEWLVPRQKLGVFFDMAKDWIAKNPDADVAARRDGLGKLWDSVDNRLGQLVYDNLFWNRALKDGLMASVRSVGWNLGTFRELGGGVLDIKDIGRLKGFSDRTAYVVALPLVAAIYGAALGYAYTGEAPETLKDAFYPKTGKKRPDGSDDRVSLPTYMKDVFAYGEDLTNFGKYGADPTQTLQNKTHPLISTVAQMLKNEDFFGAAIRNPADPAVQQIADEAKYIAQQFMPFSMRNYAQQAKLAHEEPSVGGYLTSPSMIGITPAPGHVVKSEAEQESSQISKLRDPLMRKFRQELKDGATLHDLLPKMIASGLGQRDIEYVYASSRETPRPHRLKHFGQVAQEAAE